MRGPLAWLPALVVGLMAAAWALVTACSRPPVPKAHPKTPEPARITQFYVTVPNMPRGEKSLLCYGVENAKSVWLEPPRQELSPTLARCLEVTPEATTTYTLSAQGAEGAPATEKVTITVGPPHARIIEVNVSSLEVARGAPVTICYQVANARSVRIDPIRFTAGAGDRGCTTVTPQKTTTYTVVVTGAGGSRDEEKVTVKVL